MPRRRIIAAISVALVAIPSSPRADARSITASIRIAINAGVHAAGSVAPPARTTTIILAEKRKPAASTPAESPHSKTPLPAPEPPVDNRELEQPQRTSPEAANDLFQLLKRAGSKQGQKPK